MAFRSLAKYIGVFGNPENDQQAAASGNEQIAMTAPVVTGQEEPIAAVAGRQAEPIAMTAPVVTSADGQGENQNAIGYMQFLLPSKYTQIEDAPQPTNPKLHLVQVPCRLLAVHQYSGFTDYADAQAKVCLESVFPTVKLSSISFTRPTQLRKSFLNTGPSTFSVHAARRSHSLP